MTNSTFSANTGGAAISSNYSSGNLTVTSSAFSGNSLAIQTFNAAAIVTTSTFAGNDYAISNDGTLTVTNSTFYGNNGTIDNGTYACSQPTGCVGTLAVINSIFSNGRPILNEGTATVTNTTFSQNDGGDLGSGAIYNIEGTLEVTDSTFSSNSAYSGAGAIDNGGGILKVSNTTFSGNTSTWGGGAIANSGSLAMSGCTFVDNSAGADVGGGAIYNGGGGTLTITTSTFESNSSAGDGGAIANTVGGIGASLGVMSSTFAGNSSVGYGGAIANEGGTVSVTNSTVAGNSGDGAIANYATASQSFSATFSVINSTFFNNSAAVINGRIGRTLTARATFTNTIVADSTSGTNCLGTVAITDGGHNLDSGTSCGFNGATGSLNNTAPLFDSAGLANNGGATKTIAVRAGSPAINAGDESVCLAPPVNNVDQRGYARPGTGSVSCSIGAYEFNSPGSPDCCQCQISCAAPVNDLCGDCMLVLNASCESGQLCVLHTPTSTPTITATATATASRPNTSTPTITFTPTITPTATPTATNTAGLNDCCQCADFCAGPIAGRCGGCAVVFGASCAGGLTCGSQTPSNTPTKTPIATATYTSTTTPTFTPTTTPGGPTLTPTPQPNGRPCTDDQQCASGVCADGVCCATQCIPPYRCDEPISTLSGDGYCNSTGPGVCHPALDNGCSCVRDTDCISVNCDHGSCAFERTPTRAVPPTSTPRPCVGDCDGSRDVSINELITMVNIALGTAQPSACPDGIPSGDGVNISLIIQAVNDSLSGCPRSSARAPTT